MIFPRGGQFGASGTTTFCSKRHNQGVLILKAKDLERKVEKKKLQRVSNLREPSPYVPSCPKQHGGHRYQFSE